jgi:hypothetical protein
MVRSFARTSLKVVPSIWKPYIPARLPPCALRRRYAIMGKCEFCDEPAVVRMWSGLLPVDGTVTIDTYWVCDYHAELFTRHKAS